MAQQCKIHPVPATGTCHNCRAYTCDRCAKVGRPCPYCKLAEIVPVEEARKPVNQCVNHPGIRAEAACPDCERIFCASCLNPFGQCFPCGLRNPRQHPTMAPAPGEGGARGRAGGKGKRKPPKKHRFGVARFVIGTAILAGVFALLNWQYQTLKAAVTKGKGAPGGVTANVKAYNKAVEAHGKDVDDIMSRIESGQYSEEDARAVDDLMARIEAGEENLNTLGGGTRAKLQHAESLLRRGRPVEEGVEPAVEPVQEPRKPYQGPPIRLRVGGGGERAESGHGGRGKLVAVYRTVPVKVAIMSPAAGARVRGTTVVTASLTGAGIDRVEFQVNGQWQGLSNQPPFRFDWDTTGVRNGAVTLRVVAHDTGGRQHASRPVRVTVQN